MKMIKHLVCRIFGQNHSINSIHYIYPATKRHGRNKIIFVRTIDMTVAFNREVIIFTKKLTLDVTTKRRLYRSPITGGPILGKRETLNKLER